MTQNSSAYPFIGEVAGERTGIIQLPAVDTGMLSAPTETFTRFGTALTNITQGASALITGGLGYFKVSFNATIYRVPLFTNA